MIAQYIHIGMLAEVRKEPQYNRRGKCNTKLLTVGMDILGITTKASMTAHPQIFRFVNE